MAVIKDKWKVFSIQQCFSTEMSDAAAVKLFDGLSDCGSSIEIESYLQDDFRLNKWAPFENMDNDDFVEHLVALAEHAQVVAGTPEV